MKPKNEIMLPEQMREMATEYRQNSRLYSRTADGAEVVQALVSRLAEELMENPQKIDLRNEALIVKVAVAYVSSCAKAGTIPSKIGLCRAMGVSRQAVDYFLSRHGDEPSAERLRLIFDSFAEMLNSAALASACHPIVSIFLSKALYGYRDTLSVETEYKIDPLNPYKVSAAEIAEKYRNLLPD